MMIQVRAVAGAVLATGLVAAGAVRAAPPLPPLATAMPPGVAGLDGDWVGALAVGGRGLALTLHIKGGQGGPVATLDSPDQGAFGIPITSLARAADRVSFKIASIGATFAGTLTRGGDILGGVFTQGGEDFPLTLARKPAGSAAVKLSRPQEEAIAATPPPYRIESASFANPSAPDVRLSGTLTVPKGPGPFPAVLLIAGSGRNDRDEDVFGHKVFLVLADHLTRHGLAVLRYDKRGVGLSTGAYKEATTLDFASDAEAAFAWLRTKPEIDRARVGLIGHSEGGAIAPMVAAGNRDVAFVVLMAGPGVSGQVLLPEQGRLISLTMGEPTAKVSQTYAMEKRVFGAVVRAKDGPTAQASARAIMESAEERASTAEIEQMADSVGRPWVRWFLSHDPLPPLRRLRVPILVLNGGKDLQVPPQVDLPPIHAALAANRRATIIEMPGLNHLFQRAATGSPAEYARIDETLSPDLLLTVDDWIGKRVR